MPTLLRRAGLVLFLTGFAVWIGSLTLSQFQLTETILSQTIKAEHLPAIRARTASMLGKRYDSQIQFIGDFKAALNQINDEYRRRQEWDRIIYDKYAFSVTKAASTGFFPQHTGLFFILSIVVAICGALLYSMAGRQLPTGSTNDHLFHHSATSRGWIGISVAVFLIGFYVLLYFYPEYLTNWVLLVDPLNRALSGNANTGPSASQWFLYGTLYTLVILVMGVRMLVRYRNNPYQQVRTVSVMFFQITFAFLLAELLARFNLPGQDLKNMWPLDYAFFFDYRIENHLQAGTLGIWMLIWGIALFVVGVPVLTYFFGKRWYCSWVCGCGGLAETLGDPYRHLSDKSLKAWQIERYSVHGVLAFAVVMTLGVLYTVFTGSGSVLGISTYDLRSWYGFGIGSVFAGVVGTGFYPLMGSRVWCRFGCPLAAYLGLVQRIKSRFRITTNGGQCISCGNCSTYCEMGIDVRWYAQRGQDIVRSSCVGCGICSAVCPRGVLTLENGPVNGRQLEPRPIVLDTDGARIGPYEPTISRPAIS